MVRKGSRTRSRSLSRGRVEYGVNGLPLASFLKVSQIGKVYEDDEGHLKQVMKVRGKLVWRKAEIKELTKTRSDYYYNEIDKNLDDEDKIRDILIHVLKEVQPVISRL